jgi:arylsulfatase A-like enzyme/Tfp pilus assembly protein PilF
MRVFRRLLFLLILAQCAGAATTPRAATSAPPATANRPNIIIITLDTTRADRMGFLGSTRGLTPTLDALAKQAVVFTRAYAQVPLTTPSHAAIFTGTYPQFNHLDFMGEPLGKDLPYLPDILRHHGYRTAAFVGSFIIDPNNVVAAGFGRGWDVYDAHFHNKAKGEDRYASVERRAEVVVDHALGWLSKRPPGPFLMWVHCYDPHAPYDPPEPYKEKYRSEPYDGEIAYTDAAMGKLFSGLKKLGLYDGALIAVMADHGESLGDHGERHHGIFLYDETIHVPLLFKLPGKLAAGERVDERVQLVDVAPTVLKRIGIVAPTVMQGQSLLDLITKKPVSQDRPAYSMTDYAHRAFGWSGLQSWRTGKYLYVDAPERELYDQTIDAGAQHNLAPSSKAVADTLQGQVDSFFKKTSGLATAHTKLTPEQAESLQALGYVGTDASASLNPNDRGADPKGRTDIADLLDQALSSLQEDDFENAIPKLQEVIAKEPNTPMAYSQLGRAFVHQGQFEKALPVLKTAVEKLAQDGVTHYNYGRALLETGDWAEAAPQFEAALATNPKSPEMHFYVGLVYERTQRLPEAMKQFQEAIRLNPNHFRANLLLGRLYGMQGDGKSALPFLKAAAKIDPKSIEAHMFLANVYGQLGQMENAQRERAAVEKLKGSGGQ